MDEYINEGAAAPLQDLMQGPDPVAENQIGVGGPAQWTAPALQPVPRARLFAPAWVVVTAAIVAGLMLLAVTFGIGVAVGTHVGRFSRGAVGAMMQPPGGWNGGNGLNSDERSSDRQGPNGWRNEQQGDRDNPYGGRGGRGRAFPRALPSPDATTQP